MFLNDHFGCYMDNRIEMEKSWKRVSIRRPVRIVCVTSVRSDNCLGCYGGTRDEGKWVVVVLNPLTFFLLKESLVPCPLVWAEHTDSLEHTEYEGKGLLPQCPTPRHCGFLLFSLCTICSWRLPRATSRGCTVAMEELWVEGQRPPSTYQDELARPLCDWANLEVETRVPVKHLETEAPGDIWLPLPEGPWVRSPQLSCSPTPDRNKIKRKPAWDSNYSLPL